MYGALTLRAETHFHSNCLVYTTFTVWFGLAWFGFRFQTEYMYCQHISLFHSHFLSSVVCSSLSLLHTHTHTHSLYFNLIQSTHKQSSPLLITISFVLLFTILFYFYIMEFFPLHITFAVP